MRRVLPPPSSANPHNGQAKVLARAGLELCKSAGASRSKRLGGPADFPCRPRDRRQPGFVEQKKGICSRRMPQSKITANTDAEWARAWRLRLVAGCTTRRTGLLSER